MENVGYIFPGQGSQYVGMGKELLRYKEAQLIFEEASDLLGYDAKRLCMDGPAERLSLTEYSQPLILTVSYAYLKVLSHLSVPEPMIVAGHSLGEYSTLVASSSLRFRQALRIVKKRAHFMADAARKNPGGMLAILGLERDRVEEICRDSGVEIANLNCPGQIVVSGRKKNIEVAERMAKERAKVVRLATSGPFHSSLMRDAEEKMAKLLEDEEIRSPNVRVVPNVLAEPTDDPEVIRSSLIRQVAERVRWEESMRAIEKEGVSLLIEIGPGKVLCGLAKRTVQIETRAVEDMLKSLDKD
jgi:[acyl-carrier-protein] S-malonyltransferase